MEAQKQEVNNFEYWDGVAGNDIVQQLKEYKKTTDPNKL